jgi:drug/metabolite transporter (DMT)-like permease
MLCGLIACWGSSFVTMKVAVDSISPEWTVAGRLTAASALLVPLVFARGGSLMVVLRHPVWILWLALSGTIAPFVLIAWGTKQVDSAVAGVLMGAVPLVVIVLAHFLLPDERMTAAKAAGFLIGFCGIIVLVGPEQLLQFSAQGLAFWGQIAILCATVFYGLHGTTTRLMPRIDAVQLATATIVVGAIIAVPLAWLSSPDGLEQASWRSALAVVSLGVFPTAIASLMLYRLLVTAGASFVSLSNYMVPVCAVILGALLLSETVTVTMLTGCALILLGIALSQRLYRRLLPAKG